MSVVLVIQYAKRMRHVILSSVACQVSPHSSTLSHKRQNFCNKTVIEHKASVLISSANSHSLQFLIVRRIQRDIINVDTSPCKVPVILVRIRWNLSFLDRFSENSSSLTRVVTCGQTDMTKLIVAFRNFANAPDNGLAKNNLLVGPKTLSSEMWPIADSYLRHSWWRQCVSR